MAKDRLKRRIAEALLGSSVRDELRLILGGDELGSTAAHAVLHPILENVKDPILAVAADGIVQEANSAAARLLDAAVEDIVGRDVARFIPTLVPAPPVLDALAEPVTGGRCFSCCACATSRNGCTTNKRCAKAKRVIARSSRTRPKRSSCSTSIATYSSKSTTTRSSSSSFRARSCCSWLPKQFAPSVRATASGRATCT